MAAFDRRRIPAPEISIAPTYDSPLENGIEAGPSRLDRRNDEARPIFLKTGLISQANGSGYIECGNIKMACSVYGPRPKPPPYSPLGTLNLEVKFAPFASDPRRAPLRDTEPAQLSLQLTQLLSPIVQLHLLPKSSIDIFLIILESDSINSVLSMGLTVASAALADAGIALYALGVGTNLSLSLSLSLPQEGEEGEGGILVDPSKKEELIGKSNLVIGSMPALNKITSINLSGKVDIDQALRMIDSALIASRETHTVLAQSLIQGAEERVSA